MTRTLYQCDTCTNIYPTEAQASACEAQRLEPKFKVGDFVYFWARFGWYDGDPAWLHHTASREDEEAFHGHTTHAPWYVVTDIDTEEPRGRPDYPLMTPPSVGNEGCHRVRYHVATGLFKDSSGYSGGYTFDEHHLTPKPADREPPAEVRAAAAAMIGRKFESLL